MNNPLLQAKNIIKTYNEDKIRTNVLKGVNIDIYSNELTAIVGKSGSGKSTLLHILGTLDKADSGEIIYKGEELLKLSDKKKAAFRNIHLGFVYQFHHLLSDFSALENVMMPMLIAGINKNDAKQRALELLEKVALSEKADSRPSELSGGQRQRVAIARALANNPELILADEPTGNLDEKNAQMVFSLFEKLVKEDKIAVVIVTHDNSLSEKCDRVYTMKDGIIHE
ncbi:MAG: lipoprotein-releasing ABC transporter ATP-binding protein LolD [Succinivibrio sp.]|uniref:Lipoprotein-releasing system ATP-binding protein LolD n=1 Tax=Succinivibrio faecicola TaxID=2820300 RepID=A0ABS7DGQ2_9GAMM|nr:lipoprotein-releasing ABC transporter ATP-binding protein LolD [Succinivibrio faecicola]MBW7569716.1 lipoprotein-releasing ABC transporter ATP-binding protein LolD [Succinivibrio faecicola]